MTVKSTGCEFDSHLRKLNIYSHLYFHFFARVSRQSAALSSATQQEMPPELGGKWRTECLNTRFLLPTLLCAGQREADKTDVEFHQSVEYLKMDNKTIPK